MKQNGTSSRRVKTVVARQFGSPDAALRHYIYPKFRVKDLTHPVSSLNIEDATGIGYTIRIFVGPLILLLRRGVSNKNKWRAFVLRELYSGFASDIYAAEYEGGFQMQWKIVCWMEQCCQVLGQPLSKAKLYLLLGKNFIVLLASLNWLYHKIFQVLMNVWCINLLLVL